MHSKIITNVLDHGFVSLVDKMGSDLTVVNSARVSFGNKSEELSDKDEKLIKYLAEHKHYSPFRHVQFQFHIKMPEFLARQHYKHVVGASYTEGPPPMHVVDHAWNEISLRYIDASNIDFYLPDRFRRQAKNNKQASTNETLNPLIELYSGSYKLSASEALKGHCENAKSFYSSLIESGVAKEQARMVLPLNFYTEFYWTVSLQALSNYITLRDHEGAQYEIREYAKALYELTKPYVPVSLEALTYG